MLPAGGGRNALNFTHNISWTRRAISGIREAPPKVNHMEKKFNRPRPRRARGPSGPRPGQAPASEDMETSNAPSGHLSAEVVQDIAEAVMAGQEESSAAQTQTEPASLPEAAPAAPAEESGDSGPDGQENSAAAGPPADGQRPPRDQRPPRNNNNEARPPRDPQAQQLAAQQRREAEQARREAEQQRREQERLRREEEQRRRQADQARRESEDRARLPLDDLCSKAWDIFLAEVGEEGVELFPDNEARELSRRSFRLAEIFLQEELRVRRPSPPPQPPQPLQPRENRDRERDRDRDRERNDRQQQAGQGGSDSPSPKEPLEDPSTEPASHDGGAPSAPQTVAAAGGEPAEVPAADFAPQESGESNADPENRDSSPPTES